MELQIFNPTEKNAVKAIEWNFEELKKEITERALDYKTLVYTDDNIKEAKADRANLNKLTKALEDKRKEVKKMMLEPYTKFEAQVKELVAIISDANSNIDSQVKAYDQKKRDEKFEKVKQIYENTFSVEGVEGLKEIITFERAFKDTYLNASTTQKAIINEMEDLRDTVKHSLEIINADTSGYQFEMKQAYLKRFNMTDALDAKNQCEENARKKAEYEAKKKAEEAARMEREKAEAERMAAAGQKISNNTTGTKNADMCINPEKGTVQNESEPESEMIELAFKVIATAEQLNMLKEFLIQNKIKYEPVQ